MLVTQVVIQLVILLVIQLTMLTIGRMQDPRTMYIKTRAFKGNSQVVKVIRLAIKVKREATLILERIHTR